MNRQLTRRWKWLFAAGLTLLLAVLARAGATTTLAQTGSDGLNGSAVQSLGAGPSTDGEYKLIGSVGQLAGGQMSGSGYSLEAGFLAATNTAASVYLPLVVR